MTTYAKSIDGLWVCPDLKLELVLHVLSCIFIWNFPNTIVWLKLGGDDLNATLEGGMLGTWNLDRSCRMKFINFWHWNEIGIMCALRVGNVKWSDQGHGVAEETPFLVRTKLTWNERFAVEAGEIVGSKWSFGLSKRSKKLWKVMKKAKAMVIVGRSWNYENEAVKRKGICGWKCMWNYYL